MVELIWDGKYDADGKRAAPLRVALPFQTVETVNESAQQRQRMLDLFSAGRDPEWRNRLIWGDKKYVLPSLLPEFAGKVDLIYIDPPFATGADFSFTAQVGDESFEKEPSIIEQKAYRDTWGRGLDSYLAWFYDTVVMLHELLSERGSIYVHCDWRVNSAARMIMDEIFGSSCFRNEIAWHYSGWNKRLLDSFEKRHDSILFYGKNYGQIFNSYFEAWSSKEEYVKKRKQKIRLDEDGREFVLSDAGGGNRVKRFLEEALRDGVVVDDVWDLDKLNNSANELVNYPTQKPEALIERIINASSNEGDLVLDCFAGSGTTAAVAEKLNRRWITCDLGRFAIHTTRKRLLGIEGVKPFVVQNLGKYERQVWQKAEFGDSAEHVIRAYRRFLLDLYHADPVDGYVWLHGKKGGRMVHVATVDAPITPADVTAIAADFRRAIGTGADAPKVAGVDILGWDFALDMNETTRQIADAAGLNVRFVRIPREVLESKAVEQGDVHFFELAALSVDVTVHKREVRVELTDFMVPPDDVPDDVIKAVKHWSEWIDYWAVDFDYRGDAFHNQWQTYRTRKDRSLQLSVTHPYTEPGEYTLLIKVIDILGNDTTKGVTVTLG